MISFRIILEVAEDAALCVTLNASMLTIQKYAPTPSLVT